MSLTELYLLGTGTPNLVPNKFQSSQLLIVNQQPYVFDCGGGTLQRLIQLKHQYQLDHLHFSDLTQLFITHLHPDHTTGLADFIIAPWVEGRHEMLNIYGSAGIDDLVDGLIDAFKMSIDAHLSGIAPINAPLQCVPHIIDEGIIFEDDNISVEAFAADHNQMIAYGFKITTPDQVIVLSGDTAPSARLVDFARDCEVLIHEVYCEQTLASRTAHWQAYHRAVHTSTQELAEIATQVKPKLLVLTHQLYWGATDKDLLEEISELYEGDVVSGQDLDKIL